MFIIIHLEFKFNFRISEFGFDFILSSLLISSTKNHLRFWLFYVFVIFGFLISLSLILFRHWFVFVGAESCRANKKGIGREKLELKS